MRYPKVTKLPSGNYRMQPMIDGVRYSLVAPSEKEVKLKYRELVGGIEFEKHVPLTIGTAIDKYIELKKNSLSPSTISGYKKVRKYYLQSLMDVNITKLTHEMVQKAVDQDKKKYAPKTVMNAHGLLSPVLKEYRPRFSLATTLPRKNSNRKDIRIPTETEVKQLMVAAEGTKYKVPILLALWLGLRMSEIRGLRFSDFGGEYLHIQRAVVTGEEYKPALNEYTKTPDGDRTIKIPQELTNIVLAISHSSPDDYITNLSEGAIYKGFIRCCEKANITPCRFHDLRHFSASEGHAQQIPIKYLQKRMGHKTDNMLKTVYLHTISEQEEYYADIMDAKMSSLLLHTNLHTENIKDKELQSS